MFKNVNDQEFEELLRFLPVEVKQKSTVSLEHAHNVKACRVPISVSSMPFAMGSERSQTIILSFPDIVVIVNTQDFVQKRKIKAKIDENLVDANDRWVKIISERKQGQLSNFTYTMGDLGGNSSFFVGFVESIGEGLTDLIPGDHVLPVFTGECQDCVHCKLEESNMYDMLRISTDRCVMLIDGKSKFSVKGKPIHHFVGTSTFSEYTVVHVGCLSKINPATPLDKVYVLSCGISTGFGATVNVAAEGARVSGASRIIGVDLNANRFKGGSIAAMISAFECVHDGWGVAVLVGVPNKDDAFKMHPMNILNERTLKGASSGKVHYSCNPILRDQQGVRSHA
ncbi:hypothetical protein GIB67_040669 [Kingdonia uniflora]|uniref:alcohol dehydrogenase n=1 Tax=Kingdonia uniflora TaxID=39325 RepID=A0A7J7KU63_9MAGN|nr:hypothetical protein GIB67_040669 [Kingdonia uniflora]